MYKFLDELITLFSNIPLVNVVNLFWYTRS